MYERIPHPPSLDPKFVSHLTDTLSSSISPLGLDLSTIINNEWFYLSLNKLNFSVKSWKTDKIGRSPSIIPTIPGYLKN